MTTNHRPELIRGNKTHPHDQWTHISELSLGQERAMFCNFLLIKLFTFSSSGSVQSCIIRPQLYQWSQTEGWGRKDEGTV